MSTALYRRYRPETFADVIGQEHVTEPLMAALRGDRVTHAYLFSGPRGCGKTTSARIFARCLNCAEGPTDTPCGVCDSCVDLARGGAGSLDVVEMDAASHGGVDDARDLRERAAFAPARDRFKIFIIDEAHMVSNQGFNALLKLVEEPPRHVKFVFATTEPEKVIGTIRSRTHHYPFRLVPPERLQSYLEELCTAEGVRVAGGVLPLVVRAGGGSVRDSLSVLDQLIAGAENGEVSYERAISLLGYTDATLLDDVVEAIAARDGASVFRVVDRVIESGHDPRRFVEDLLERLRDLVVIAVAGERAGSVLRAAPQDQLERMRLQAQHLGPAQLSRAADLVNDALTEMTGATSPRLQLELLCARILLPGADDGARGHGARLERIERHLSSVAAAGRAAASGGGVPAGTPAGAAAPAGPGPGAPTASPGAATTTAPSRPDAAATTAPTGSAAPARTAPSGSDAPSTPASDAGVPAGTPAASDDRGAQAAGPGSSPTTAPRGAVPAGTPGAGRSATDDPAATGPAGGGPAGGSPTPAGPAGGAAGATTPAQPSGDVPAGTSDTPGARPSVSASTLPDRDERGGHGAAPGTTDGGTREEPATPASRPATPASRPTAPTPQSEPSATAAQSRPSTPASAPAPAAPAPAAAPAAPDVDADMVRRRWPEVLETLARLRRGTWALVSQDGHVAEIGGGVLRLAFSTAGLAQTFRNGNHVEPLQRALAETLGVQVRIEAVLSQAAEGGPGGGPGSAPGGPGGRPGGGRGGTDSPPADGPMPATTWEPAAEPEWAPPEEPFDAGPEPFGAPASPRGPVGQRESGDPGASDARHRPDSSRTGPAGDGSNRPPGGDRPWGGDRPSGPGSPAPRARDARAPGAPGYGDRPGGTHGAGPAHGSARTSAKDDHPSMDDPDAEDSGLVGAPLVARLLGGTVIDEQDDRAPGAP